MAKISPRRKSPFVRLAPMLILGVLAIVVLTIALYTSKTNLDNRSPAYTGTSNPPPYGPCNNMDGQWCRYYSNCPIPPQNAKCTKDGSGSFTRAR